MAPGVEVEHEGDERPLELGAGAEGGGEAGAGHLGAALEVEDAEGRPEVPVRPGGRRRRRGGSPTTRSTRLAVGVGAAGEARVGEVGEGGFEVGEDGLGLGEAGLAGADVVLEPGHGGDLGRGVAPLLLELTDRAAGLVAPALEVLDLDQAGAALGVEGEPAVERLGGGAAGGEAGAHPLGVAAEEVAGQHDGGSVLAAREGGQRGGEGARGEVRRRTRRVDAAAGCCVRSGQEPRFG